jgi:hypothetical protein
LQYTFEGDFVQNPLTTAFNVVSIDSGVCVALRVGPVSSLPLQSGLGQRRDLLDIIVARLLL